MQNSVFSEDMIFIEPPIQKLERDSIIDFLSEKLAEKGFTTSAYLNEVLKREAEHPTGLPTKPYGCAVPHANPIGVKKTGIALAVLRDPIQFFCMDKPKKVLDVHLIFLMSFLDGKQVTMLRWISNVLSDQQIVKKIAEAKTANEVYKSIEPFLNHDPKGV